MEWVVGGVDVRGEILRVAQDDIAVVSGWWLGWIVKGGRLWRPNAPLHTRSLRFGRDDIAVGGMW
ncbi:MAG: hypothetical protein WD208_05015 [Dehalococcoidia bacterium]